MNNNSPQSQLALGAEPTIQTQPQIDMGALLDEWRLASSYVEQYTRDFKLLDDIVDGVPINHDNDAPFVGDTTLAGLVRSIPRDSLQQLPTFSVSVNGTKVSIPALICTYLLKRIVFNQDTFGKGLLSTLQIGAEQALTHGYAPFMVTTGMMFNDFGTMLRLLHFMDTAPEPGIQDHNETGFDYMVANLTPSRVRKILKAALANPNTSWNTDALKRVLENPPKPTNYSIWESAAKRNQPGEQAGPTYQFITRIETGPDSTKITFCPDVQDVPLRVIDRRSKWGYPTVMYLVIDPAALTPFGVSRVRLASPNQNLMNLYYGQIASMLLLNSKPPVLQRGRFSTPVELKRGVVWKALDTNANATLVNMDNGALEQFVPMAQQFAAQIQNIMGRTTGTVNANSGVFGFSKTAPGVQQQQNYMDVSTKQITNILENFLRQYALVGLDTLLSEQTGVDRLIVDDDTKNQINQIVDEKNAQIAAANQNLPPEQQQQALQKIGDDNKINMDWERFYQAIEEWSVEISVSLTPDEMKDKKRADMQDMLTVLAQNAQNIPGAAQKIEELTNMLLQDETPLVGTLPVGGPAPSGPSGRPPVESISYKDIAGTPAGNAMLQQAQLPTGQ